MSLASDRWVRLVGGFRLVSLLRRSAGRCRVAARQERSLSSEGELPRGHPAEGTARSLGVVIKPPGFNEYPGVFEIEEPVLVEAFVAHGSVEALDEGVLDRFTGLLDELQLHAVLVGPSVERLARELRAVVRQDAFRMPQFSDEAVEHSATPVTAQGGVHLGSETFTGVVVDDIQGPDPAAIGELVAHEVHRPAVVAVTSCFRLLAAPQSRFSLLSHRDLELLFAVNAVDALVVVTEAFTPKRISQQPVAPAPSLRRRSLQRAPEELVVVRPWPVVDAARVHSDQPAGASEAHGMDLLDMPHRLALLRGLHHLFEFTSFRSGCRGLDRPPAA